MSTHRNNKSRPVQNPVTSFHPLWQGALFLTGAVAGAAFLIKSLRLQAEMQADALHAVREQHLDLSEQVRDLTQKVDHLSATVGELSLVSQSDSVQSPEMNDAQNKGSIEKTRPLPSAEASSSLRTKPQTRKRKSTDVPQEAGKARKKASPKQDERAPDKSQDLASAALTEALPAPASDSD